MNNLVIYLDSTPTPPGIPIWMWAAILFIIYWFILRPTMKKHREDEGFFSELKKGDKVTTIGGIHGKINAIKETTMILEIADNIRITIDKQSISREKSTDNQPKKGKQ